MLTAVGKNNLLKKKMPCAWLRIFMRDEVVFDNRCQRTVKRQQLSVLHSNSPIKNLLTHGIIINAQSNDNNTLHSN